MITPGPPPGSSKHTQLMAKNRAERQEARRRRDELLRSEAVTSAERKDKYGRNVQLFEHGICIVGNRLINHILNQAYGADNAGDNVQ